MSEPQSLSPTPVKYPGLSLLAKGLAGVNSFATAEDKAVPGKKANALLSGLASLVGLPEAQALMEKLAYGERLTTGKGQTLKPAENVVEGALALAPLAQGLARGAASLASLAPKAKPGQVNSLLGGLAKDDPSLWLSHGSNPSELLRSDGSLVRELYNPSFALTRDKLSEFKSSKGVIVPWPDKLDPKNAKTLITATDGYVPRWHASKAGRIDNLPWDVKLDSGLANPRVEEFINQRLFEKFGTPFPRQGIKAEGGSGAPKGALPLLGRGKGGMTLRKNPVYGRGDLFDNRIAMSPRFQSLESFAQSPYGGKLVGETTGRDRLQEVETELEALYKNLLLENTSRWKGPNDPSQVPLAEANWTFGSGFSRIDLLKGLASNTHPSQLYSRFKSPDNFLSQLRISDNGTPRPLTPAETRDLQKTAGRLLGQIKTAPSDYAELKSYGPWQVSGDNVAGIVERKDYYGNSGRLREASAARRLPYAFVDSRADETAAAADFLSRKGKSQVSLVKGLAAKQPPPSSKNALEKFIEDFDEFTPVKEPSLTKGMASPEPGLIDIDGWFAKSIAGASKPVKDWHQASWKELNSLSQKDVEAMPHTEWNVWNAAYSDHMDALLAKDWASESKMHLLDILKSAEWQFYPEGAKTAIKAALGIK